MEQWLEWARGPAFRTCFLIMALGLARVVFISTLNIVSILRASKKNKRQVPWGEIFIATLKWMIPLKKSVEQRAIFSITSMLFHICIIVTPIFLGAHVLLWERGLGISWPTISNLAADYLTLAAIGTGVIIFVQRVSAKASRAISRTQDYFLPLLITVPFISGYLAMHPSANPFDYTTTMFVHVMSANLIFVLIPFTKISHAVLFPGTQLISELGWHHVPGAGQKIAVTLGKENEPI